MKLNRWKHYRYGYFIIVLKSLDKFTGLISFQRKQKKFWRSGSGVSYRCKIKDRYSFESSSFSFSLTTKRIFVQDTKEKMVKFLKREVDKNLKNWKIDPEIKKLKSLWHIKRNWKG